MFIIKFSIFLSILIIVHEFGHFITAKRLGVRVERFSIGFGPKLFSRVINDTEFLVCLVPLGGYVKMAGDERSHWTGREEEFCSKPAGHRALIVLNGPVLNFILAYLTFVFVFLIGYPGLSTRVEEVVEGGPAYQAGLHVGDKILAIDSRPVYGRSHLARRLEGENPRPVKVKFLRGKQEITRQVLPKVVRERNMVGQYRFTRDLGLGYYSNVIGGIAKNFPAQDAGLQEGDEIIRIDGKAVKSWKQIQTSIADSKGEVIEIDIDRDGKPMSLSIRPKILKEKGDFGQEKTVRKIGIGPLVEFDSYSFSLGQAVVFAFEELVYITTATCKTLYSVVTGSIQARKSITGPVGIFYIVKEASEEGLANILLILGVISASLAIFNLLPLPVLDGGHLFFLGLEKLRGRSLSERTEDIISRVGLSFIIGLALFVFYNDFSRFGLIEKFMNFWR